MMTTLTTANDEMSGISSTAKIIFRLLRESKGDEMLSRLKAKLCMTKEEICKLVYTM